MKQQLQEIVRKTEDECGLKVWLVERAGSKLQQHVPGLHFRADGVVYRGDCTTCLEKGPSSLPDRNGNVNPVVVRKPGTKSGYFGETSRNTLVRGEHHLAAIENPELHTDNAFAQHSIKYHQGETPEYVLSVVGCHPRPLERQIWEGVLIRKGERELDILMNSKQDHFAPAVGRVVVRHAIGD